MTYPIKRSRVLETNDNIIYVVEIKIKFLIIASSMFFLAYSSNYLIEQIFIVEIMSIFHQTIVILWILSLFAATSFEPHCNLHQVVNSEGIGSRISSSLPTPATTNWLHPTQDEIISWYDKEKHKCESYLQRLLKPEKMKHNKEILEPDEHETNKKKLSSCRGYKSLLQQSGKLVWPFGPYETCPPYSKCWFGLLTCGSTNTSNIETNITPSIRSEMRDKMSKKGEKVDVSSIKFTQWSIRSLYFQIRFVGQEIVVPEVRYYSLPDKDDVLIGQYYTTLNEVRDDETNLYPSSQLEIRHVDWHPAILHSYEPTNLLQTISDLQNVGRIFLGDDTHICDRKHICRAECDEVVQVVTTPLKVNTRYPVDSRPSCFLNKHRYPLPTCFLDININAFNGRWIRAPFYDSPTSPAAITAANEQGEINIQQQKLVDFCDKSRKPKRPPVTHYNAHTARLKKQQDAETALQPKFNCTFYAATNYTITLASTITTYCTHKTKYNILDLPYLHSSLPPSDQLFTLPEHDLKTNLSIYNSRIAFFPAIASSPNIYHPNPNRRRHFAFPRWQSWYEASGNPCIFDHNDEDDYGSGFWFYAPYQCKYHFYERSEIYQCFRVQKIHHIHVHGDSVVSSVGRALSRLLGISIMNEDEYHKLREKQTAATEDFPNGVIITEGMK
jgi:hypothetical protein